jgi:maleylpyruvate isomerase
MSTVSGPPPVAKGINRYRRTVTADPLVLLAEIDRATARLLATAAEFDGDPATPSALPGWTRGHLLTHVARNADGGVNLLTWARTGVITPQYPSWEQRGKDIEAGAGRPLAELIADIRDSAERYAEAAAALHADHWTAVLDLPAGPTRAAVLPWKRLREVEVHHVDLAAGYRPADWPESFAHRLLHEVAHDHQDTNLTVRPEETGHPLLLGTGGPPTVSGPASALAAWLAGRSTGAGLTVDPSGQLPALPDWM